MPKSRSTGYFYPALLSGIYILAACGGSSAPATGSSPTSTAAASGSASGQNDAAVPEAPATVVPAAPKTAASTASFSAPNLNVAMLQLPANIVDGSTVQLECGKVYTGRLIVERKSNVSIKTSGTCGNAVITPARAIGGWTQYKGNIYSAPAPFDVASLMMDGLPASQAHWPSATQTWAKAAAATSTTLSYPLPNDDVTGATLMFRANDWSIEARKITAYSGTTMTLASTGNISFDGYGLPGQPDFYLEGKLWMLDEPGEWAVDNGRLYVWMPDGQAPAQRVVASPGMDVVDARNSKNVSLSGITLYGGANGINALGATGLRVVDTKIVNASENGILNSGGKGLYVDGATLLRSRHDAIAVKWGGGAEVIQNSVIDSSGVTGMPTNAHSAVNLTVADGSRVVNNKVLNSGNIGIRVFRNATVSNNIVDAACVVLTDCGGIYVHAPDKLPLNTLIDSNTVTNVGGTAKRLTWAIDLDNAANAVTVKNNTISRNFNGMQIHNGFNNLISGNRFSQSVQAHIQMAEGGSVASVRGNAVRNNVFSSLNKEETYRLSSSLGASSVGQFAVYDGNDYTSSSATFANFNGQALSYDQWKAKTNQDAASVFHTP